MPVLIQCTYDVMLAGCSGGGGACRHSSVPAGDVIGKSKAGEVTSVTAGALAGGSVHVTCWMKMPPCPAAGGGGACSGSDMPCLLYTSPSPRDRTRSRMPSSA